MQAGTRTDSLAAWATKRARYIFLAMTVVSTSTAGLAANAVADPTPLQAASAKFYRCVERSEAAAPVPPLLSGAAAQRAAIGNPPPLCSGGTVPEPVTLQGASEMTKARPNGGEESGASLIEPNLLTPAIESERPASCEYQRSAYYCHVLEARRTPNKKALSWVPT
jgi:hypothetical protein